MKIRNHKELEEAYQSGMIDRFFITPDAKTIVKQSLEFHLGLLEESYGAQGEGGFINVISEPISTDKGYQQYTEALAEYGLEPSDCEFDDTLVQNSEYSVHFMLYVLTEFHVMLLYIKKER